MENQMYINGIRDDTIFIGRDNNMFQYLTDHVETLPSDFFQDVERQKPLLRDLTEEQTIYVMEFITKLENYYYDHITYMCPQTQESYDRKLQALYCDVNFKKIQADYEMINKN